MQKIGKNEETGQLIVTMSEVEWQVVSMLAEIINMVSMLSNRTVVGPSVAAQPECITKPPAAAAAGRDTHTPSAAASGKKTKQCCGACGAVKPVSDFYANQGKCKICLAEHVKRYRKSREKKVSPPSPAVQRALDSRAVAARPSRNEAETKNCAKCKNLFLRSELKNNFCYCPRCSHDIAKARYDRAKGSPPSNTTTVLPPPVVRTQPEPEPKKA